MKKLFILSIGLLSSINLFAQEPAIDAPLRQDEWEHLKKTAPILIQVDFENTTDNLTFFDYDTKIIDPKTKKPIGEFTTADNFDDRARKLLTVDTEAGVDWMYNEDGGAVITYFLFHRPLSKNPNPVGTDRRIDAESAMILQKKRKIEPTAIAGFDFTSTIGISIAHGAPIYTACSDDSVNCIGPNFVGTDGLKRWTGLEDYMVNQTKANNRQFEILDGRMVLVSEHYTHSLVWLTDSIQLLQDAKAKKMMIYYPEGADIQETLKIFQGAQFRPYKLRDKELTELAKTRGSEFTIAGNIEPKRVTRNSFYGKKVGLVSNLFGEFLGPNNTDSDANFFLSQGITPLVDSKGNAHTPTSFKDTPPVYNKDGSVKMKDKKEVQKEERISMAHSHLVTTRCLKSFYTEEEIERGAALPIRATVLEEVKAKPAEAK